MVDELANSTDVALITLGRNAGEYTLMVGASSADIRGTAKVTLSAPVIADEVSVKLNPSPKVSGITAK